MNTLFDAGKLVGEDMNECYLLVEQAAVMFPDNQVSVLFFHINLVSSSHVFCLYISHCRTVYTTCSEPQRIPGTLRMKLYICFGLTVRRGILWKKATLKSGTAQKCTRVSFALMRTRKVFRSFLFSAALLTITTSAWSQLFPFILVSTTISSRRGFGWWIRRTMTLHLPFRFPYIASVKAQRRLRRLLTFTT